MSTNPLKLVVIARPNGGVSQWVPMTDEEYAVAQADEVAAEARAARAEQNAADAVAEAATLSSLADKLDANTATPDEVRHALAECLRGLAV